LANNGAYHCLRFTTTRQTEETGQTFFSEMGTEGIHDENGGQRRNRIEEKDRDRIEEIDRDRIEEIDRDRIEEKDRDRLKENDRDRFDLRDRILHRESNTGVNAKDLVLENPKDDEHLKGCKCLSVIF